MVLTPFSPLCWSELLGAVGPEVVDGPFMALPFEVPVDPVSLVAAIAVPESAAVNTANANAELNFLFMGWSLFVNERDTRIGIFASRCMDQTHGPGGKIFKNEELAMNGY